MFENHSLERKLVFITMGDVWEYFQVMWKKIQPHISEKHAAVRDIAGTNCFTVSFWDRCIKTGRLTMSESFSLIGCSWERIKMRCYNRFSFKPQTRELSTDGIFPWVVYAYPFCWISLIKDLWALLCLQTGCDECKRNYVSFRDASAARVLKAVRQCENKPKLECFVRLRCHTD